MAMLYMIFGGCIVLAVFWMLASLPVMRMGSSKASLAFDVVITLAVLALFAAGAWAYAGQLNRKAAGADAVTESESGEAMEEESAGEPEGAGSESGAGPEAGQPSGESGGMEPSAGAPAGTETAEGTDAGVRSPQGEGDAGTSAPQGASDENGGPSASGSLVPAEDGAPSSDEAVPAQPETAPAQSGG